MEGNAGRSYNLLPPHELPDFIQPVMAPRKSEPPVTVLPTAVSHQLEPKFSHKDLRGIMNESPIKFMFKDRTLLKEKQS